MLKDVPVGLYVYDLLELNNQDLRDQSMQERREKLEELFHQNNSKLLRHVITNYKAYSHGGTKALHFKNGRRHKARIASNDDMDYVDNSCNLGTTDLQQDLKLSENFQQADKYMKKREAADMPDDQNTQTNQTIFLQRRQYSYSG